MPFDHATCRERMVVHRVTSRDHAWEGRMEQQSYCHYWSCAVRWSSTRHRLPSYWMEQEHGAEPHYHCHGRHCLPLPDEQEMVVDVVMQMMHAVSESWMDESHCCHCCHHSDRRCCRCCHCHSSHRRNEVDCPSPSLVDAMMSHCHYRSHDV